VTVSSGKLKEKKLAQRGEYVIMTEGRFSKRGRKYRILCPSSLSDAVLSMRADL